MNERRRAAEAERDRVAREAEAVCDDARHYSGSLSAGRSARRRAPLRSEREKTRSGDTELPRRSSADCWRSWRARRWPVPRDGAPAERPELSVRGTLDFHGDASSKTESRTMSPERGHLWLKGDRDGPATLSSPAATPIE